MNVVGLLVLFALVVAILLASRIGRQRVADSRQRLEQDVTVGAEVMTTSGLYATVVSLADDGSAVLSIAPAVEVRWAVAALRPVEKLPPQYRRGADGPPRPNL